MAKILTLHCDTCGTTRTFTGEDATAILTAIDAANWRDKPTDDLPRGHVRAECGCDQNEGGTAKW